ncbi:MAG TPA: hypothetical protein VNZ44_18630 [Pyrinomonadaceae bacterium]|nr:hypothetical protein [Pyrinomonadaceae bacterium]
MRKLTGLLVFVVALAGAIFLTRYYKQKYDTPPQPAPQPTAAAPAPPSTGAGVTTAPPPSTYTDAKGNAHVTFKTQQVALDLAGKKARAALTLERDPTRPAPASVWVWAYFFSTDAPGRYCAGDPVELRQPFPAGGGRAEVKVELPVRNCPAPRGPSSTYYARVNTSAESAFAARLAESRISYDITQASPVVLEGGQR